MIGAGAATLVARGAALGPAGAGLELVQFGDTAAPLRIRLWSLRQTVVFPDGYFGCAPVQLLGVLAVKPDIAGPQQLPN